MKTFIATLLGSAALLAGPLAAQAQSGGQWVNVPSGFTAVLLPDNAASVSLPIMPDPAAMIQQMNLLLAQAEQNAAALQAQFVSMQNTMPETGEMITTISDGSHSCTERITYPGDGAQAQVHLTSTANGCALVGLGQSMPALAPNTAPRSPSTPKLIEARSSTGNMMLADRD